MGQGPTPLHRLRMRVLEVNFLLTIINVALNNVFSGFSDNKEILLDLNADNAMALNMGQDTTGMQGGWYSFGIISSYWTTGTYSWDLFKAV